MRWSHVGLNCRDPRRTGEFYMRWFGFVPARAVPVDDGEVLFLKKGDAYLELFPAALHRTVPTAPGPRYRAWSGISHSKPMMWTRSWPTWTAPPR